MRTKLKKKQNERHFSTLVNQHESQVKKKEKRERRRKRNEK
jgi:hypothetical protein